MQLAAMVVFNIAERDRFDLAIDDATYYQGWWLISHGHLRGFTTLGGFDYIRLNAEFLAYPLAMISRPILTQTTFLIFEDLCLAGAGAVGLVWILEIVRRPTWPTRFPPWIAVSTYVLLVAINPWLYLSIADPFHFEPVSVPFLMLAAYFVEHRQWKRAAVFVVLCMACGAAANAFLVGLGIGVLLAGRRWRRVGLMLVLAGVSMLLLITSLHLSGTVAEFGPLVTGGKPGASRAALQPHAILLLKSILEHPGRPLRLLWEHRLNIYANLGPSGIVGLISPWGFGVPFASLLVSELANARALNEPAYQNAAIYVFVPFGTIFFLRRIALVRRIPRSLTLGITGLVTANAILWAVVWLPVLPSQWLRVSPAAAAVLRRADDAIPSGAQVVASDGIVGSFAGRQFVENFAAHRRYPVEAKTIFFVVTPNQGVESTDVSDQLALVAGLADKMHATLVEHGHGVWVFRWNPPKNVTSFDIPSNRTTLPAWTAPGPVGTDVFLGRPENWLVASNGHPGYVVAQDYWRRSIGHYQADVSLSANIPVNVEVWNQTSDTLLARRQVPATNGLEAISFNFDLARLAPTKTVSGTGVFKIAPIAPAPGNSIEIRVWTPGNGSVSVYRIGVRQLGHSQV